ncbi:MAG: DNA polymerase IV [Candidatus Dormibacteraeota bacterium]|nr:DNA polymerase IV [Candidatus Dormibacteraeota bacterium]
MPTPILHADLDCFFASVEIRDEPSLRGRPVIVGPGVVMSASYEARAAGVRSAMSQRVALRLCPDAVIRKARMRAYSQASKEVFEIFDRTSPVVEAMSIDEAFLDLRGLERIRGTAEEIAQDLRARVRREAGLPITVGVARTKFLAKVASGVAKPDGLLVVPPWGEREFLHPLPVERLWGVGAATSAKLHRIGVRTVGDLTRFQERELVHTLGPHGGSHLHNLAHGLDPRRVRAGRRRASVGAQHALGWSPRAQGEVDKTLLELTERVCSRLRGDGRAGRTVVLRLRFEDFGVISRSRTLARATAETATVLQALRELFAGEIETIRRRGLTLVGVTVENLDAGVEQLELPLDRAANLALDRALDRVRERFGDDAVTRASLLGRERRDWVPVLPAR